MRACAKIHETALIIERYLSIFRKILYELYLIGLTLLFHEFDSFRSGQRKSCDLMSFLDDLLHLCLEIVKILS